MLYTRAAQHTTEAVRLLATSAKPMGERLVNAYIYHIGTLLDDDLPDDNTRAQLERIREFFSSREPEVRGEGTAHASVRRRRRETLSRVAGQMFDLMHSVQEHRNVSLY
ncbi:hypothetical protein [Maricaulis sp.]|uniref:hypothetical protein n=1 Tax=Maricaulis sp. TaxID=1486257 RepID=UPI001B1885C4|nr:hypothetical protein [Maricaulis sp.]MBO6764097.1 hypothetical protein [Maricaulis sp.]